MFSRLDVNNANDCFVLARKFKLEKLKTSALGVIRTNCTLDTFYAYHEFALENNFPEVEQIVDQFLRTNLWSVIKAQDWEKLLEKTRFQLIEDQLKKLPVSPEFVFGQRKLDFVVLIKILNSKNGGKMSRGQFWCLPMDF
jgi:hypothetical protein